MEQEVFNNLKRGDIVTTRKNEKFIFEKLIPAHSEKIIDEEVQVYNPHYLAYCYTPFTHNSANFARYFTKEELICEY